MPLHLLGKKSWNPYLPQNIARIKADEEEAAAREKELDELKDEYDADVRHAKLKGKSPPPVPERIRHLEDAVPSVNRKRNPVDKNDNDRKKRRRRPGEDDTQRDIRLARDAHDATQHSRLYPGANRTPITDKSGHIQLFDPGPDPHSDQRGTNAESEYKAKNKERESDDQYSMRFASAAGRQYSASNAPWYASREMHSTQSRVRTNVFGEEDPARHKRDQQRMGALDPMAAMQVAQSQLKDADRLKGLGREATERERRGWDRREQKREQQRKHRSQCHHRRHRSRSPARARHSSHS